MSLWDRMRSGASRAAGAAQEAAQEAKKQASIARLNMQVSDCKSEIRRKTEDLGEAGLRLVRQGELTHPTLQGIFEEIAKLETRMADLEQQITAIRSGATATEEKVAPDATEEKAAAGTTEEKAAADAKV